MKNEHNYVYSIHYPGVLTGELENTQDGKTDITE